MTDDYNPFAFTDQILITSEFNTGNNYVLEVVEAARKFTNQYQFYCNPKAFWTPTKDYSIVHIQWIEELFTDWEIKHDDDLTRLERTLKAWKKYSKIALTLHNHQPHQPDERMSKAYQIVFDHCDAVIHMDQWSADRYLTNIKSNIIPHPNYQYREQYGRHAARQYFGIEEDDPVILVFGAVRNDGEKSRILSLQKSLVCESVKWLIPRWQYSGSQFQKLVDKLQFKFNKSFMVDNQWVGALDVAYYFEAADIVLIPRGEVLNSGNLILGFNFGKVVVGPNFGNIGAILMRNQNPTFKPADHDDILQSVKDGLSMIGSDQGRKNKQYANKYWDRNKIGVQQVFFYKDLLSNTLA